MNNLLKIFVYLFCYNKYEFKVQRNETHLVHSVEDFTEHAFLYFKSLNFKVLAFSISI